MNVAIVTAAMRSGERGGAEAFYGGLAAAIEAAGHNVSCLPVAVDESSFTAVLESYARCYDLDTSAFDVVISTKAPTYMVRHPRHISYLVHTLRVFYDRFEGEYGHGTPVQQRQRRLVHDLDRGGLHPSRVLRHFAIGHTCYARLLESDAWWQRVPFSVLHLPPAFQSFPRPRRGEYVFLPGRLHRWKRPDLVVRAFRQVKRNIPLLIAGTGEDEALVRREAAGDSRIQFLGAVSDDQLLELYSGALLVPFVPVQEDYGLVTIEAFRTCKPVITCTDSGEPLQFVKHGVNGYIVEPDERALADRIRFLIDHPATAKAMGKEGCKTVGHIRWDAVVSSLFKTVPSRGRTATAASRGRTAAVASSPRPVRSKQPTTVAILDMQPIEPAFGGGRLRLRGLYHDLGPSCVATYVGTYDWPGESFRRHQITDGLTEIDVPLGAAHFEAAAQWQALADGRTVIDVSFPLLAHHSPEYIHAARTAVTDADVVVCSHPWVFPLISDVLQRQFVVYDAHNVESVLRWRLLGDSTFGRHLARCAAAVEYNLCRRADLVLACSHQDRLLLHRLYGVPLAKCLVAPNGTFVGDLPDPSARTDRKRALGLHDGPLAVFIGSLFPPNEEAAAFICEQLAPALPDVTFSILGGVGQAIDPSRLLTRGVRNVRITGTLPDSERQAYLSAADIAINPMFSGSGTNIKMFDFMAAGLPVVTTPTGARGIRPGMPPAMHVCEAREFPGAVARVLGDSSYASRLGAAARRQACESYSWERLSRNLGCRLARHGKPVHMAPRFSVVVATYERHEHLPALLDCLAAQSEGDFELILVDQSASPWQMPDAWPSLDVMYVRTDVKGVVKARNLGVWHARGDIIAFTDDDCRPDPSWLKSARTYFERDVVVGVEGLIVSENVNDRAFRAVTNVGFEGIGFMTANLFVRRETFNAIDGFDEQFDHPHFREDTDLGWRACTLGEIPFAGDVRVYHPPHPRTTDREGHAERVRFFEKDALLLKKHPERYRTLFLKEGHYLHTKGFLEHFTRGAEKYGVNLDGFLNAVSGSGGGRHHDVGAL